MTTQPPADADHCYIYVCPHCGYRQAHPAKFLSVYCGACAPRRTQEMNYQGIQGEPPVRSLAGLPCCLECPSCAAKPGTPNLCADCLRRRAHCFDVHHQERDLKTKPQPPAERMRDLAYVAYWRHTCKMTGSYQLHRRIQDPALRDPKCPGCTAIATLASLATIGAYVEGMPGVQATTDPDGRVSLSVERSSLSASRNTWAVSAEDSDGIGTTIISTASTPLEALERAAESKEPTP